ncbi:Ctr copper transporter family-domain-containing protein [Trichoderma sp. SZMC 28011]
MDSASPSMDMPMGATSAMAMPSSTADPMDMQSSNMTMNMESMIMAFFTSTSTPLWSSAFTPNTTGQYAGACIFLIAFAVVFRMLLALRFNLYKVVAVVKQRRSGGLLPPDITETKATPRPWRANEAILSGALDTVIAGVSYLLMVAVMTMNVGYFLSVLGGVFLGSVLCSHLTGSAGGH